MLILFPFVVVSFHRLIHHGSNPVVIIDYINLLRKLSLSCSNLKPPSCYQIMSHFLWGFVKTSHCHVKITSTCSPHGPRRAQVRDLGLGQFACMLRSLLSASTAVLTPFVLSHGRMPNVTAMSALPCSARLVSWYFYYMSSSFQRISMQCLWYANMYIFVYKFETLLEQEHPLYICIIGLLKEMPALTFLQVRQLEILDAWNTQGNGERQDFPNAKGFPRSWQN